ncbi:MAG: saccharopine dehydrogenase, partial [Pseudomonadales bacterium]|nr:saccharopine dehydrogenase [Pseudomonadales bacterium]
FVMAAINTRVVRRSNALMDYKYGSEFRYSESMLMGNGPGGYIKASLVAGMSGLLMLLTAFKPTRSLLAPLMPSPGEGPSEEAIAKGYFNVEFCGIASGESTKKLKVTVTGDRDPGYGATSKMLAESAVCLAKDSLSVAGGIWTPSTAMGDLLLDRLEENAGMQFTVSE